MRQIIVIAHNVRSTHNVGSLLRTADGLGLVHVYLTGYTPYPKQADESRLPHLADKIDAQIHKTALDAEHTIAWTNQESVFEVIEHLRQQGYTVVALEQTADSIHLPKFSVPDKVALLLGREVEGIEPEVLSAVDCVVEIPMFGHKESFNVVQAAAMALYYCRFA